MVCVRSCRTKDRTDTETLFRRFAGACGQESACGRKLLECCEAVAGGRVKVIKWVRCFFGHGIGQSEQDGRAPRAEAGGPLGLDP